LPAVQNVVVSRMSQYILLHSWRDDLTVS